MAEMAVEPYRGTSSTWDESLSHLEGRTFCHQAGWGDVFARVFGHDAIRLVARAPDGTVEGLLPLVRMRSRLFGHHLVSMPFLNYGGPVGGPQARLELALHAVELARESGARRMELRARTVGDLGLPASREKVTVVLDLPDDPVALWEERLKAKVRSQVRRPMKAGMTVRFGHEQVHAFYRVFCRNMRDLGTPVLPMALFEAIADEFEEQVLVAVVLRGGEPVAAGFGLLYQGEFELTWASALREHAQEAPNMLLYWSIIEDVIRRGASTFNFGRCSPGGGTHRFKLQWGGRDQQLHWVRWSRSGQHAAPSPDSPAFKAAMMAWQRLPLPLANVLGPLVSRSLPTW